MIGRTYILQLGVASVSHVYRCLVIHPGYFVKDRLSATAPRGYSIFRYWSDSSKLSVLDNTVYPLPHFSKKFQTVLASGKSQVLPVLQTLFLGHQCPFLFLKSMSTCKIIKSNNNETKCYSNITKKHPSHI